jgi:uncharacterized membrane protein
MHNKRKKAPKQAIKEATKKAKKLKVNNKYFLGKKKRVCILIYSFFL